MQTLNISLQMQSTADIFLLKKHWVPFMAAKQTEDAMKNMMYLSESVYRDRYIGLHSTSNAY